MGKILDKRGRLLGLVNIIDLLLIVIIIAGLFAVAHNRLGWGSRTAVERQPIEVVMVVEAVREPTVAVIQPGDEVRDSRTNTYLGQVTAVEVEPASVVYLGNDGRFYETSSPSRMDIWVTLRGDASVSSNLIQLGETEVRVGVLVPIKTNIYAVSARIMYIHLWPED